MVSEPSSSWVSQLRNRLVGSKALLMKGVILNYLSINLFCDLLKICFELSTLTALNTTEYIPSTISHSQFKEVLIAARVAPR
jgi:hypothetical protein